MGNINTYGFILNYQVGGLSVYKRFLRLEASHASLTKLIIVLKHHSVAIRISYIFASSTYTIFPCITDKLSSIPHLVRHLTVFPGFY